MNPGPRTSNLIPTFQPMILDEIPETELPGEQVILRLLHEPDAAELYRLIDVSREHLSQFLPWPPDCNSEEDVVSRLETWEMQAQMGNGGCWGIFEKTDGGNVLAGCIFIGWVHPEHCSATVSYWLGQDFIGRGLATEALNLLSRFCFLELGLNRLEITAAVENTPSIAVARRCGYRQEGICRQYESLRGWFLDHVLLSKLASDEVLDSKLQQLGARFRS